MNQPDLIPWSQLEAEVRLAHWLVDRPPWVAERTKHDGTTAVDADRGLRAQYRRWRPADEVPSVEMLAPLWRKVSLNPEGFSDEDTERAVHHAAVVLHLLALGADAEAPATSAANLGAACATQKEGSGGKLVAEGRFARLMNTPAPGRIEAMGRTFRRFRQAGVRWSTDDLDNLFRFLFTDDTKSAVAHWAAGYYRTESLDPTDDAAADEAPAEAV